MAPSSDEDGLLETVTLYWNTLADNNSTTKPQHARIRRDKNTIVVIPPKSCKRKTHRQLIRAGKHVQHKIIYDLMEELVMSHLDTLLMRHRNAPGIRDNIPDEISQEDSPVRSLFARLGMLPPSQKRGSAEVVIEKI